MACGSGVGENWEQRSLTSDCPLPTHNPTWIHFYSSSWRKPCWRNFLAVKRKRFLKYYFKSLKFVADKINSKLWQADVPEKSYKWEKKMLQTYFIKHLKYIWCFIKHVSFFKTACTEFVINNSIGLKVQQLNAVWT